MEVIAKWIVVFFGIYVLFVGFLMLLSPLKARAILRKAGSTNFINYAEITLRMIPAIALILYADFAKFPEAFEIFGWFMLITSFVLYLVPRRMHHTYSLKCADLLTPFYFQLISPFAMLFGLAIIYCVI